MPRQIKNAAKKLAQLSKIGLDSNGLIRKMATDGSDRILCSLVLVCPTWYVVALKIRLQVGESLAGSVLVGVDQDCVVGADHSKLAVVEWQIVHVTEDLVNVRAGVMQCVNVDVLSNSRRPRETHGP